MKKIFMVILTLVFALSFAACQKDTEAPIDKKALPGNHPPIDGGSAAPAPVVVPQEREIVIPDNVKGKWASVVLVIDDKAGGKTSEQTVALNSEYTIAEANIKIKVMEFLPDFIMEGPVITSRTAENNNPAALIVVTEGEKELFNGWIYSKYPAIHPFTHDKYGVTLKEGKKKG